MNKRNFNLKKEVGATYLFRPVGRIACPSKYELRKEACKRCRTRSVASPRHCSLLVKTMNTGPNTGSSSWQLRIQRRRTTRKLRDWSVKYRNGGYGRSFTIASDAAEGKRHCQCHSSSLHSQLRGRQRNQEREGVALPGKAQAKAARTTVLPRSLVEAASSVDQLMKMGPRATKLFHPSNRDQAICFNFQKRQCADPKVCNRRHVCIGCATEQ